VVGKDRNNQNLVYLLATYVPGGTSGKAKTFGTHKLRMLGYLYGKRFDSKIV
jgi:hypothetical protein